MSDADDFFANSAGKSARFPDVGTVVTGAVVSFEQQQSTDMDGKPQFWDNGDKRMQLKVGIQTDDRDPEIEGDDGVRYLYVKGSKKPESHSLYAAVATALRRADAKLEAGGVLSVTLTFKAPSPNPKKLANEYSATYQAPNFFAEPATATVPAQQNGSAAPDPIATAKQLLSVASLTDEQIATTTGLSADAVAALRSPVPF